jgi:hypothetical protein
MKVTFKGKLFTGVYSFRTYGKRYPQTDLYRDGERIAVFSFCYPDELVDFCSSEFTIQDLLDGKLGEDEMKLLSSMFQLFRLPNGRYSLCIQDNEVCIIDFGGKIPEHLAGMLRGEVPEVDGFDLHEAAGRFFGTEF